MEVCDLINHIDPSRLKALAHAEHELSKTPPDSSGGTATGNGTSDSAKYNTSGGNSGRKTTNAKPKGPPANSGRKALVGGDAQNGDGLPSSSGRKASSAEAAAVDGLPSSSGRKASSAKAAAVEDKQPRFDSVKKQVFSIKRSDHTELAIGLGTIEWNDHHYAGDRCGQQLSWLRITAAWHLGGSASP